ncbi:MAG: hypothetical protein ACYSUX_16415 [Planctomycetota bacterium]|jgi:ABC-type transporter Mla subunit MlaD
MGENYSIKDEQVGHTDSKIEFLLDGMSDRIADTVENIADLADEVEELSGEIKSLLDDLRALQREAEQANKDKIEPLIDQLEGVSKELQNTLWTMDFATEDLLEGMDIEQIFDQQNEGLN